MRTAREDQGFTYAVFATAVVLCVVTILLYVGIERGWIQ